MAEPDTKNTSAKNVFSLDEKHTYHIERVDRHHYRIVDKGIVEAGSHGIRVSGTKQKPMTFDKDEVLTLTGNGHKAIVKVAGNLGIGADTKPNIAVDKNTQIKDAEHEEELSLLGRYKLTRVDMGAQRAAGRAPGAPTVAPSGHGGGGEVIERSDRDAYSFGTNHTPRMTGIEKGRQALGQYADENGIIQHDKLPQEKEGLAELSKKLDLNHDGKTTIAEIRAILGKSLRMENADINSLAVPQTPAKGAAPAPQQAPSEETQRARERHGHDKDHKMSLSDVLKAAGKSDPRNRHADQHHHRPLTAPHTPQRFKPPGEPEPRR